MSDQPQAVILGPEEEAARLWQGAKEAFTRAGDNVASLSESLDLGLRAVEILIVNKLQGVKVDFPATIGLLLDTPEPEVDLVRDAVTMPHTLQFTDVLDLLSDETLDCVGPSLHRGWEDRRFSCRRSRATAQEAIGITLGAEERSRLMILAAYRNRIFRSPPPIRIVPEEILSAFDALENLIDRLL